MMFCLTAAAQMAADDLVGEHVDPRRAPLHWPLCRRPPPLQHQAELQRLLEVLPHLHHSFQYSMRRQRWGSAHESTAALAAVGGDPKP